MAKPKYVDWFEKSALQAATSDGIKVEIWELHHREDEEVLSDWARHFRQHYCPDSLLSDLVSGTGHTNASYLTAMKFPDAKRAPGPSTRAGDFGEILLADYAEYLLDYWCPREGRYENRDNRDVPSNGCDVVGLKFVTPGAVSPRDELLLMECKAGLTPRTKDRLQEAINHSIKDLTREAMSLSAIKQRLLRSDISAAKRVERFQNENDRPFTRVNIAAAIVDHASFDLAELAATVASKHPNAKRLRLLVIRGPSMMDLVHKLYERAAYEA